MNPCRTINGKIFSSSKVSLGLLILPLLVLLPSIGSFPYPSYPFLGGQFSDIVITHYPNAIFLLRALKEWHTIPLWNPTILSGYPFFADPLSGLWYPFGWIALLLPLPLGFNLMVIFHLLWFGLGMYAWLRTEGLAHMAALWGALAVMSLPKLYAHYGAGHLTLLYAIAWTPWLLYASGQEGIYYLSISRINIRLPAGVILAMIFLADVRWAFYAGILWAFYIIWHKGINKGIFSDILLGFLLSAPLAIPLIEYISLSTRSSMTTEEALSLSLPFVGLLGFIFPTLKGFFEWVCYPGMPTIVFGLCALLCITRMRKKVFWIIIVISAILFSMGSFFPAFAFLVRLPVLGLLRVPPRALFVADFALVILASFGLDDLLCRVLSENESKLKKMLFGVNLFIIILGVALLHTGGSFPYEYRWSIGFIVLITLAFLLQFIGKLSIERWFTYIVLLSVFEAMILNHYGFISQSKDRVLSENIEVAQFFGDQPGTFRIYSPSYSVPQQTLASYGLESADGVNPIQLSNYVVFMEKASGIPMKGYSVTLPPFENGNPATANAQYKPDNELLGLLNVAYLVAEYPLDVGGLKLVSRFGNTYIYENQRAKPRAWIQIDQVNEEFVSVENVNWHPNRITLKGKGPGLLILSEISYPGWESYVDGRRVEMKTVEGILRAVELLPGEHQIEFVFRPISLRIGVVLFLLGLLRLAMVAFGNRT
jgi:hypothetical protein